MGKCQKKQPTFAHAFSFVYHFFSASSTPPSSINHCKGMMTKYYTGPIPTPSPLYCSVSGSQHHIVLQINYCHVMDPYAFIQSCFIGFRNCACLYPLPILLISGLKFSNSQLRILIFRNS